MMDKKIVSQWWMKESNPMMNNIFNIMEWCGSIMAKYRNFINVW